MELYLYLPKGRPKAQHQARKGQNTPPPAAQPPTHNVPNEGIGRKSHRSRERQGHMGKGASRRCNSVLRGRNTGKREGAWQGDKGQGPAGGGGDASADGVEVPPTPINALLEGLFAVERHVVGRVRLPFGVSLIGVARKS